MIELKITRVAGFPMFMAYNKPYRLSQCGLRASFYLQSSWVYSILSTWASPLPQTNN